MKEPDSDSPLSITFNIESLVQGQLHAMMEWPVAQYYGPVTIDLNGLLDKLQSYHDDLGFVAGRITHLKEDKLKDLRNWQNSLADEFCQRFYESAFKGFLEQLGDQAYGRTILLRVHVPDGLIEAFPWELLGSPRGACFQKGNILFSVHRGIEAEQRVYQVTNPVKLLFLSSYPKDLPNIHSEYPVIKSVFDDHPKARLMHQGPELTYYEFRQSMRTNPDIVHLSIHGKENGEGLFFVRDQASQIIPLYSIVQFIREIKSLKILVLNACYSAAPHIYDTYSLASIARQLVVGGLPAVVGMATAITDRAAIEFSQWFYTELRDSSSVIQAFHTAVDNLRNYNLPDGLLWSIPMLDINRDINPFAEILKDLVRENNSYFVPLELLEETSTLLTEFIRAFRRIEFLPLENEFQWQLETRSLSRVQNQIRPQLNILKQQLQSTNQLARRTLSLEIEKLSDAVSADVVSFLKTTPDWLTLDFSEEDIIKRVNSFLTNGSILVGKMENLVSKLNGFSRSPY